MKKICSLLLSIMLLCGMFCVPVSADTPIRVVVGGERVKFDVDPITANGRTLVPLRAICEALGCTVTWNAETEVVDIQNDGAYIALKINNYNMKRILRTNAEQEEIISLDVPPIVHNGRTLVPVRAISEAFGLPVYWNEATQTVQIKVKVSVPVAEVSSDGSWKKYTYDANGNLTYFEDSDGYCEKSTYDANGNETYHEKSNGYWYKYTYDANGNRTYYETSNGYWEKSTYDANGNLTYWEPSDGRWAKSTYDANGNLTYYERFDGDWYKYTYDANGNLTYWETSDGYWIKSTYDANGNLTYMEYSSGDWEKYTYSYDENGNTISQEYIYSSGYTVTTLYTYNDEGYLTQKVEEMRQSDREPTYTTTTYMVIEK